MLSQPIKGEALGTVCSFWGARLLPTFDGDERIDRFVSGYIIIRQWYDGWRNMCEIQPFRTPPQFIGGVQCPVGEPYNIMVSLLRHMVCMGAQGRVEA